MKPAHSLNPNGLRIVLVLQGGGALGAYQAGVYQALQEHGLQPDWVVGTSIGAINAALIAGNPETIRLQRLRQFWQRVSHPDGIELSRLPDTQRRCCISLSVFDTLLRGIPGFFTPRPFSLFSTGIPVPPKRPAFTIRLHSPAPWMN